MRTKKYKVEKSEFPEDNKTHLVVMYSNTMYGVNYQRVFKGTYKECVAKKEELTAEEKNKMKETLKGDKK